MDHPCWRCGEEIESGDLYCAHCGAAQQRKRIVVNPTSVPDVPDRTLRRLQDSGEFETQRSSAGPIAIGAAIGLVLIVAAAVGVYVYQERPWDEERHEITGSVTLYDEDLLLYEAQTGSGCTGSGGFSNIAWQATVTVYDGSGNVVGSSRLDFGDAIDRTTCRFPFTVLDVRDADFYEVRVAGRNGPTYSRQDLELPGWSVHLSIGDQS